MGRKYGDLYSIAPYTSSHPVIIHPIPNPSTYNTTVHVHLRWFIFYKRHPPILIFAWSIFYNLYQGFPYLQRLLSPFMPIIKIIT